jgi:hypothetical protein
MIWKLTHLRKKIITDTCIADDVAENCNSRRFTLGPKKYYCTFYRSDIEPPEKVQNNQRFQKRSNGNRK